MAEVIFDPSLVSFEEMATFAKFHECARPLYALNDRQYEIAKAVGGFAVEKTDKSFRQAKDDKYYLGRTDLRFLPMTQAQRTRVNAKVEKAESWLSPRQLTLWKLIQDNPKAGWKIAAGKNMIADWKAAQEVLEKLISEQAR